MLSLLLIILGSKCAEDYQQLVLYQSLTGQPVCPIEQIKAQVMAPEVVLAGDGVL